MAGDFCFYLLHAGYNFSVRTRYNQRTDWRCVDRQSLATLTTTDNIIMICGQSHNHDADFVWLAEGSLISGVRKSCGEEATPIPSIYDEELGGLSNTDCDETIVDMIRQVLTFQACRSSLYRSRAKTAFLPRKDKHRWAMAGERFLLCDDTDPHGNRIIVFTTHLIKLSGSERVFTDGTFFLVLH